MKRILFALSWFAVAGVVSSCESKPDLNSGDAVKSDPGHYKVEFENSHIRVLRTTIGPKEKTTLHSHPANVVITLTANNTRETLGDGTATEVKGKAHDVGSNAPRTHSMENLGDSVMESIVIELKDPQ